MPHSETQSPLHFSMTSSSDSDDYLSATDEPDEPDEQNDTSHMSLISGKKRRKPNHSSPGSPKKIKSISKSQTIPDSVVDSKNSSDIPSTIPSQSSTPLNNTLLPGKQLNQTYISPSIEKEHTHPQDSSVSSDNSSSVIGAAESSTTSPPSSSTPKKSDSPLGQPPLDPTEKHPAAYMVRDKDTGELMSIFEIDTYGRKLEKNSPMTKSKVLIGSKSEKNQLEDLPLPVPRRMSRSLRGSSGIASLFSGGNSKLSWGRKSKIDKSLFLKESECETFTKVSPHKGTSINFAHLHHIQTLSHHSGPIWVAKFSPDGQYLATGGRDGILRVYQVSPSAVASTESHRSLDLSGSSSSSSSTPPYSPIKKSLPHPILFDPKPIREFVGHTQDILDLSWSPKKHWLLSSSLDKTVRRWQLKYNSRPTVYAHSAMVPFVSFHPLFEHRFATGCFDKQLRFWDGLENKVIASVTTPSEITAATFNSDGSTIVIGCRNGMLCIYSYSAHKFTNVTQFSVHSKRGRNRKPSKITGVVLSPKNDSMLITSNDSRSRLYRLSNYAQIMKYKGSVNPNLQIKAHFNEINSNFIIAGSATPNVFIWPTKIPSSFASKRKRQDHHEYFEYFAIPRSNLMQETQVTVACFAPKPVCYQLYHYYRVLYDQFFARSSSLIKNGKNKSVSKTVDRSTGSNISTNGPHSSSSSTSSATSTGNESSLSSPQSQVIERVKKPLVNSTPLELPSDFLKPDLSSAEHQIIVCSDYLGNLFVFANQAPLGVRSSATSLRVKTHKKSS